MRKTKLAWTLMLIVAATAIASKAKADDVKIAFVDIRRALNETNEGKKAMAKLQTQKDKMQKQIDSKEKEIMKMKETIEK